ncbi:cation diffusion facilitator family transporter [Treponema sp.]|uniref:cation diffusion facilitator family transporter n=1 Tax=Treponema sp. TaxID=166 RepID=UPI0025FC08F8|nr:cation diffusion facilitator family transporter [Treponema sp.]MCR5218461.1 cation diffusion facilitator family transporter [Treponema sp.]
MGAGKREFVIIRTSIVGVLVNIALSVFKAVAGLMSHSIAIVLDSVNNLSDALSSVITIIGTKLASKPADKKHPFGHGRIEYLTSMIIAVIILYAGIASFGEAVKKIVKPVLPDYEKVVLIIVAVSVVVKILLGLYFKRTGKKVNSDSLSASGQDALMDSIISAATLAGAFVFLITGISTEAYLGAVISVFIVKSGCEMIRDGVSSILGERIDSSYAKEIKHTIVETDPEIQGAFDLVLNNYGPDKLLGSVHIEVPSVWNAAKIDEVTRKVQTAVFEKHSVVLTGIGIYSVNVDDEETMNIRSRVAHIVMNHSNVLGMHGFYLDKVNKAISFDVIISWESRDMQYLWKHITDDIQNEFKDYSVNVALDTDISD